MNIFSSAIVILMIALAWWMYSPGLAGGFLFDDNPNLEPLGAFGGVRDWEGVKSFVFSGFSGPTGRPLSLATFLLDDNDWPSNGSWFKATNIKIHLLCGLLLLWATLLIARQWLHNEVKATWVAIISAGIWLLHPYQVSTVLYVVQRMAELAAMFVFLGLVIYLKGREQLANKPVFAYLVMTLGVGFCTLLGVLSKESAALLPLLILVVEASLPKSILKPNRYWCFLVLWTPALVLIGYLLSKFSIQDHKFPNRLFTQHERLLTEARILCEYLYHLYVPRIEGRGLFQDGYNFSTGLFSPISTFFSLIVLLLMNVFAFLARKHWPFVFLAIIFFFSAHLMESTWLSLELYFEHRNYIASAFLFFPISIILINLCGRLKIKLAIFLIGLIFAVLCFLTYQRAGLWADSNKLETYWAVATPESARAQNRLTVLLLNLGMRKEAIEHSELQDDKFKNSSLLTINRLLIKVYLGVAVKGDFDMAADRLASQPFDAQSVKGLRSLVETIEKNQRAQGFSEYAELTLDVLHAYDNNPAYKNNSMFKRFSPYLKAKLYLVSHQYSLAYEGFFQAMGEYNETDAALSMVAEMGNAGRFTEALLLLNEAENIYEHQPKRTLKRSVSVYDYEFKRMRNMLELAIDSLVER